MNDINSYKFAFNLSNYACQVAKDECIWVWNIVLNWAWFYKKNIGGQFVETIDSISANIAEVFWRYHYSQDS